MEAEMDDTWGDVDEHDISRNVNLIVHINCVKMVKSRFSNSK